MNVDGILHVSGNGIIEGNFTDGKYNTFVELEGDVPGYLKIRGYRLIWYKLNNIAKDVKRKDW